MGSMARSGKERQGWAVTKTPPWNTKLNTVNKLAMVQVDGPKGRKMTIVSKQTFFTPLKFEHPAQHRYQCQAALAALIFSTTMRIRAVLCYEVPVSAITLMSLVRI